MSDQICEDLSQSLRREVSLKSEKIETLSKLTDFWIEGDNKQGLRSTIESEKNYCSPNKLHLE